ncbi:MULTISPECIES: hypothetical protein [Microcystis]|uniref:Type IV pilin PilA n=1 Tax=Microcystis aeruginosa (strain NIES-843 / IAM M-2473) TaxID=449447 RepID=B0JN70_MICAN|nr:MULTISPECIES: hypothetical protein [Microcystis]BAG00234.1 unknown protein [Microcystis aeruginosa NIES-843]
MSYETLLAEYSCRERAIELLRQYRPYLGSAEKVFPGGRVWGVGCGVWGFTGFEVANYLIFREKVPEFSP